MAGGSACPENSCVPGGQQDPYLACASHCVVDTRGAIGGRRDKFSATRVKCHVQNLIVMPAQSIYALPGLRVPYLATGGRAREYVGMDTRGR